MPNLGGTKVRAVWIRVAHTLHNRKVPLVVKRLEADKLGIQSKMIGQAQRLSARDGKSRPSAEIGIIAKRHQSVETIIAARQLEDDQDGAVLSRCGLNGGVRSHGIEREKGALQKGGNCPGDGPAKEGSAKELSACVEGVFHVSWNSGVLIKRWTMSRRAAGEVPFFSRR